ncbi:MAG: hypothetical protein PHD13_00875 [Methanocellales archaeon]|nr:hypothetical protein [Methanocellales archaeon]MDD3291391.1 hypothetical protein [Methanocellales archaeon]MDD5234719.1 hypothetical protein [Methanocellales archaeon]MDD5484930.1 hypothetical protein [Methanocellales archaeon]
MDNKKLKILIEDCLEEIGKISYVGLIASKESLVSKYLDILINAKKLLPDHAVYLERLISNHQHNLKIGLFYQNEVENSLNHILKLLSINFPEIVETKKILENAEDKLKEAGISFENEDFSSVISKLNTGVELALKDELDIPMTIRKINTRKILDICVAHGIGPKEYLQELIKHVVEVDNKIKHQGYNPNKTEAINAISAFEGFIKSAKKYPFEVTNEIRDKIFSGI